MDSEFSVVWLINKRLEELKDTLVYSVDKMEQLHYIRGQIKGLESLLQDLKDLQKKQEQLNEKELRDFKWST